MKGIEVRRPWHLHQRHRSPPVYFHPASKSEEPACLLFTETFPRLQARNPSTSTTKNTARLLCPSQIFRHPLTRQEPPCVESTYCREYDRDLPTSAKGTISFKEQRPPPARPAAASYNIDIIIGDIGTRTSTTNARSRLRTLSPR